MMGQITRYDAKPSAANCVGLEWAQPGDPRFELVLALFEEGDQGLSLLLNGLSDSDDWRRKPSAQAIAAVSPVAQVRVGKYTTPTFVVHGSDDEVVPHSMAIRLVREMRGRGIECGLLTVPGGKHMQGVVLRPGTLRWEAEIGPGYEFLLRILAR
jgi:acetyl esterase/lipase